MDEKKTIIEVELNAWGWNVQDVNSVIKEICEEHENKRELRIKIYMGDAPVICR